MLDFIISHGRMKEKAARKFFRQILSAVGNGWGVEREGGVGDNSHSLLQVSNSLPLALLFRLLPSKLNCASRSKD